VQTQLLLDALAESNEVGVSQEEFAERVIYNAQRLGMSPDEYFQRVQEANQLASIFAEVRRGKALVGAVEKATVTDSSGTVLDIAALFGVEDIVEVEEIDDDEEAVVEAEIEEIEEIEDELDEELAGDDVVIDIVDGTFEITESVDSPPDTPEGEAAGTPGSRADS